MALSYIPSEIHLSFIDNDGDEMRSKKKKEQPVFEVWRIWWNDNTFMMYYNFFTYIYIIYIAYLQRDGVTLIEFDDETKTKGNIRWVFFFYIESL